MDRSTRATLSTYNTWIQVSRLQKIYHLPSLKLRLTTTPLAVVVARMQQGRDLPVQACNCKLVNLDALIVSANKLKQKWKIAPKSTEHKCPINVTKLSHDLHDERINVHKIWV